MTKLRSCIAFAALMMAAPAMAAEGHNRIPVRCFEAMTGAFCVFKDGTGAKQLDQNCPWSDDCALTSGRGRLTGRPWLKQEHKQDIRPGDM
jgi:hypothetical protein